MTGQPSRIGPTCDALSHRANRLAEWAMAVLLAAMTLLAGIQIAGRFVFGYSIFWSDELTRFLLVWISFLGMSIGVRRGSHPGIDSLVRALSPRAARTVLAVTLLLCLAFFGIMIIYGGVLVHRTWPQRSVSLGLRMSIPYLAVPVSGLLMLLHGVAIGVRSGPLPVADGKDHYG